MKRAVLGLALGLLAAVPAPAQLVTGSIRDQHGLPIENARVHLLGTSLRTTTAADGTFAFLAAGSAVEIRCSYCRPERAAVAPDGTVTAIVIRYDAVQNEGPDPDDLAHLPYARSESDVSLTPFTVLTQSSGPVPGATLHDASLSAPAGLLLLDGVPDYDAAAGVTTYDTIPAQDDTSIGVVRSAQGYTYGDLGISGLYNVNTSGAGDAAEEGSDAALRVAAGGPQVQTSAAYSNWSAGDTRERAGGQVTLTLPGLQGQFALSAGSADVSASQTATLSSSFSSMRLSLERTQGLDAYANLTADRGTNGYASADYPFDDTWSDVSADAGVRSDAAIAPFIDFSTRDTHGWYWSPQAAPYVSGTIDQARALGGVNATSAWVSASAAFGLNQIDDENLYPDPSSTALEGRDESFDLALHPQGGWSLRAASSSGYAIDPLFISYYTDTASPVELMSQNSLELAYSDESRVRIETLAAQTRGAAGTNDVAAGTDIAWQIAPQLSLRTWWMNVKPAAGAAQQVGSAWATFTPGALRVDVIWRRDLLNGAPDAHVDGSISAPLTQTIQCFVQTERRAGVRATDFGLRF